MSAAAYRTPEEAALAEWPPSAGARVIRVEDRTDDHAVVITDTDPSHPYRNQCRKTPAGWVCFGGSN
jgi:hypothetical protein